MENMVSQISILDNNRVYVINIVFNYVRKEHNKQYCKNCQILY